MKPAAAVLEGLRHIPVIEGDEGGDLLCQQGIHQPVVVIQPFGIGLPLAFRQDARPGGRKAVGVHPHLGHQVDIGLQVVVGIDRSLRGLLVLAKTRGVHEGVPDRETLAVLVPAAFDLEGGCGGAEQEAFGKLRVFH